MSKLNWNGKKYWFIINAYADNNNTAIDVMTDEGPWARLTVNLGHPLPEGYAFVDDNNWEDAAFFIDDNELGDYIFSGSSGYCTYPCYAFDMDKLSKYNGEDEEEDD